MKKGFVIMHLDMQHNFNIQKQGLAELQNYSKKENVTQD